MTPEIGQKFHISLALGPATTAPYGQGFNCVVEAYCRADSSAADPEIKKLIRQIVDRIDHRAVGVDVDLGIAPTLPALAEWLAEELITAGVHALTRVRLSRGDGYSVLWTR
ncbi:MAG: hypothetical protein KF799_11610 [Bdellovibrionales bacterium]|nr:hypothetical protein [Bdellovibrionales bacterium]